jgi:hypothetical protein
MQLTYIFQVEIFSTAIWPASCYLVLGIAIMYTRGLSRTVLVRVWYVL